MASGGGYLTDTWWWHASGVLSLLALAQRLGKPTAMFGQGIGPMERRLLRAQSRAVLPGLILLGLREERTGLPLAHSLGVAPAALMLTGDDALEQGSHPGAAAVGHPAGQVLGVNLRVSGYAGVDQVTAASVASVVREAAAELGAELVGLPVSRYATAADAGALRELWPGALRPGPLPPGSRRPAGIAVEDITTPEGLAAAVAPCRAVITGSYHAALFSLGAGVPAVCLIRSPYYDAKFGGLAALFPGPAAPSRSTARMPRPASGRRCGTPGSCRQRAGGGGGHRGRPARRRAAGLRPVPPGGGAPGEPG